MILAVLSFGSSLGLGVVTLGQLLSEFFPPKISPCFVFVFFERKSGLMRVSIRSLSLVENIQRHLRVGGSLGLCSLPLPCGLHSPCELRKALAKFILRTAAHVTKYLAIAVSPSTDS